MIDFTSYITERTKNFTGRGWVFAEIDHWLSDPNASSFLIIIGEPGIGKTSIAARLTQLSHLAAAHFCIARQADTLDPLNFTRSILHQLTYLNGFAQCLLEEVGIHVEAPISVQENYGQIVGVRIERLIATSASATSAFVHTIVAALKQLYSDGFEEQLVILVDALDEAVQYQGMETIIDLLASSHGLPSKVRFILTSRPDTAVLRHFEEQRIPYLVINAGQDENLLDARKYIEHQVSLSEALRAQLSKLGMKPQAFIERIVTASQGNFLYLVWLLPAIAEGTQRFDALDVLPKGLDGIYREFLRTRIVGKDIHRWRTLYRMLLGVLAVAKMPLTVEQLVQFTGLSKQVVIDFLQDIQQFLDQNLVSQKKYELYHQSIMDFLGNEERAHEFWIELIDIHKQIVDSYKRKAPTWEDMDWGKIDNYGLQYLAAHLFALRDDEAYHQDLYMLICKGFMREKQIRYGSHRSFAENVLLAIETAMNEKPPNIMQEIRGSLIYATLGSLATNIPPKVLAVLAHLGQVTKSQEFAILMQDSEKQSEAFRLISEVLLSKGAVEQAKVVLLQALEVAEAIDSEETKVDALSKVAKVLTEAGDSERAKTVADRMLEVAEVIRSEYSSQESLKSIALTKVAQILIRAGDQERAVTIAKRVLEMVDTIESEYSRAKVLKKVAKILARAGLVNQALTTAQTIEDGYSRATALKKVAKILVRAGLVDQGLEVAEVLGNEEDKVIVLRGIAGVLVQVGDYRRVEAIADQALVIAEAIEDKRQKATELSEVGRILSQIGKGVLAKYALIQAMNVAEAIGNWRQRASILDEVAQILTQIGEEKLAIAVIDAISNEVDKVLMLSELAQALIQGGYPEWTGTVINRIVEMTEVFTIENSSYEPPIATALCKVAQVLDQAGYSERAVLMAKRVLEIVEAIEDEETRASALLEMAQTLAQSGEINRLSAVIETIVDTQQKNSAWARRAEVLAEAGNFDQAKEAVAAIRDETWRATVLELVAIRLAETGLLDQALEAAKASRWKKSALRRVAEVLFESGQVDQALEAVEVIEDEEDRVAVLSKMAEVLTQMGEHARAEAVVTQVIVTAEALTVRGLGSGFSKASALVSIAEVLAQIGKHAQADAVATQALAAIEVIRHTSTQVTELCELAKILAQIGEQARAEAVATQALAVTTTEEDKLSKVFSLVNVAEVLAQIGEQARAEAVATQALTVAEALEDESKSSRVFAFGEVAKILAQIGEQARAEAVATQALAAAESLEDEKDKERELGNLGWLFAGARLIDQVSAVIEALKDDELKAWSLRMIARELVQVGESALAKAMAIQAATLIESLKDDEHKAMGFCEIAQVLVQIEELALAEALAMKALEVADKNDVIGIRPWKVTVLAKVVNVFARMGKEKRAIDVLTQALDATEAIEYKGNKLQVLNQLIQELNDAGQQDQALKVLRKAFAIARQYERASVFSVLNSGADTLSEIDKGKTLWYVYEAVQEVEKWWGKQ